jgi:hypothetical protein
MQSTNHILMIRPVTAASNPQTLASNAFQSPTTPPNALRLIQDEFDRAVELLQAASIQVTVIQDTETPSTPDAMFPNNWFSTHAGGTMILYPMLAPSRADEVKPAPMDFLQSRYPNLIDLREFEPLEGTGSLVIDRINKHVFAAISPRTSLATLRIWAQATDHTFTAFPTADADGTPIYHTNVMMALGTDWVVTCSNCMTNDRLKEHYHQSLRYRTKLFITPRQMEQFAGNMIELRTALGLPIIVLSESALQSLDSAQLSKLESIAPILPIPIPTIEKIGGGSIRCMIAELF